MTNVELEELLRDCPTLYHMAAAGSLPSILSHGLLSTSALLDLLHVEHGKERHAIERERRPESIVLHDSNLGAVTIRDNKPMDDAGLARALNDGTTPEEWYGILNAKVFFWLTRDRLTRLLLAGAYAEQEHDVLELETALLVQDFSSDIELCAINSGCTKPFPHPRGRYSFSSISTYPYSEWRGKRKRGERVVELTVAHSVTNVGKYLRRAQRMKGSQVVKELV